LSALYACSKDYAKVSLVGTEMDDGTCRYIVKVTANQDLKTLFVGDEDGHTNNVREASIGKQETRIVHLAANKPGPCRSDVKPKVVDTEPGNAGGSAVAKYSVISWSKFEATKPMHGEKCVAVAAIKVNAPGALVLQGTAFDTTGKAVERCRLADPCTTNVSRPVDKLYCYFSFRTPCKELEKVVLSRQGSAGSSKLHQSHEPVTDCSRSEYATEFKRSGTTPIPSGADGIVLGTSGEVLGWLSSVSSPTQGKLQGNNRVDRADICKKAATVVVQQR